MSVRVVVWALLISAGVAQLSLAGETERWDEIELLDGRVLSGSVTREGPNYRVRKGMGSTLVPALAVIRVRELKDPLEVYEQARAKAQGTEDRLRVAKLAESLGLRGDAKDTYRRVLVDEPDHAQARAALGFVKHAGQWLTHDEHQRALGKVKFRGAWVTLAERKGLLEAEAEGRREAAQERWTPAPAGGVGSTRTRATPRTSEGQAVAGAQSSRQRKKTNSYDRRTYRRVIQLGISTPRRSRRSSAVSPATYYPYGYQQQGYQPYSYPQQGYQGSRRRGYAPPRPYTTPRPSTPRPRPNSGYSCPRQAARGGARTPQQPVQPRTARPPSRPLAAPRQVLPLGAR